MNVWTESRIRECLDGTFTRVTYEGHVVTDNVDHNYIPTIGKGGRPVGTKNTLPHSFWSPLEDDVLIAQRHRNRPIPEIAWLLSRTVESVKKRMQVLRAQGRCS